MDTIVWQPGVSLDEVEREVIIKAYAHYGMVKNTTARVLGISIRTLDAKLEKYESDLEAEKARRAKQRVEAEAQLARARGNVPGSIAVEALTSWALPASSPAPVVPPINPPVVDKPVIAAALTTPIAGTGPVTHAAQPQQPAPIAPPPAPAQVTPASRVHPSYALGRKAK